jgi:hypothetical protein
MGTWYWRLLPLDAVPPQVEQAPHWGELVVEKAISSRTKPAVLVPLAPRGRATVLGVKWVATVCCP